MQAAPSTKRKTARFADGPGLVMLVPADLDVSQRSVSSSVTADDDVVVLEAAPFDPWLQQQQQQHARSKTLLKYDEMTTPIHAHDEINSLERTLDIGQVLTVRRRVVLGQNPVVATAEHRVLNTLAIVSLCFFAVSGGPVSTEPAISSGGPLLGLIGYVVFPLLFNLPITFVIAELCSAFPEDGGFAMWILNAWGPFWGFLEGYWAWFRSVLDRAIYIHALYYFLAEAFGFSVNSSVVRYLIKAGLAIALTLPSLFGARLMTFILASLFAVVLVVFGIFSVWGLSVSDSLSQFGDIRLKSIELFDAENVSIDGSGSGVSGATSAVLSGGWDVSIPAYINSLFWNLDGFYLASVFGGEVRNPARTYPRAFLISFAVMWLVYVVPTFAAVAANRPHWSTWEDSAFVETISLQIGGSALHTIVLVGTVVGLCGMYLAELFCEIYGRGDDQQLHDGRERVGDVPQRMSSVRKRCAVGRHQRALCRRGAADHRHGHSPAPYAAVSDASDQSARRDDHTVSRDASASRATRVFARGHAAEDLVRFDLRRRDFGWCDRRVPATAQTPFDGDFDINSMDIQSYIIDFYGISACTSPSLVSLLASLSLVVGSCRIGPTHSVSHRRIATRMSLDHVLAY